MKPKTWTHPKFELLSHRLKIGRALAAGILQGIWHLAATFDEEQGQLQCTPEELAVWLGVDIDGDQLVECLVTCRWLEQRDGGLWVHDWEDHRPKYLNDRIRMRNVRNSREQSRTVANCSEKSPPSASASASASASKKTKKKRAAARFSPPIWDEVDAFAKAQGWDSFDAAYFCDFYESKGWMVGKSQMKDWKAAARRANKAGWCDPKQNKDRNGKSEPGNGQLSFEEYTADLNCRTERIKKYLDTR